MNEKELTDEVRLEQVTPLPSELELAASSRRKSDAETTDLTRQCVLDAVLKKRKSHVFHDVFSSTLLVDPHTLASQHSPYPISTHIVYWGKTFANVTRATFLNRRSQGFLLL